MFQLNRIIPFIAIKLKKNIFQISTLAKYHIKFIVNLFVKNFYYFFIKRKIIYVKSLFAFDIHHTELKKHPDGAYRWLNYIFPNIKKYSNFKFKYLSNINFKHYLDYKIDQLIIFFPQSLGYETSCKLIYSSKKIIFFVNDNAIFCKKSYNTVFNKECFRCLKTFNPYKSCNHFPFPSKDSSYTNFLNIMKKKSKSILFVCHSSSNIKIIKSIFPNSRILEFKNTSRKFKNIKMSRNKNYRYDFLFHAHLLQSKGYFYFLQIAKLNKRLKFFVPDYDLVRDIFYKNITFDKMYWDSGLKKKIEETKIILCPSFWSANYEGSVLRTMLMGKCCAIIDNKMSFSKDIPDNCVIKLTSNLYKDSNLLNRKLNNLNEIDNIGKNARAWALAYIKDNPIKEVKLLDSFFKN